MTMVCVAGAAALLMAVDPNLKGQPARIGEILREGTITDGITDPDNTGCGGLTISDWPNYQAGYGRLDVYRSAQIAQSGDKGKPAQPQSDAKPQDTP